MSPRFCWLHNKSSYLLSLKIAGKSVSPLYPYHLWFSSDFSISLTWTAVLLHSKLRNTDFTLSIYLLSCCQKKKKKIFCNINQINSLGPTFNNKNQTLPPPADILQGKSKFLCHSRPLAIWMKPTLPVSFPFASPFKLPSYRWILYF